jgi:hypothetical protein
MNKRQAKFFFLWLVLPLILTSGCCTRLESNPARPSNVRGWQEFQRQDGIKVAGGFLLQKGEATEHGGLGIQLIDTIQGKECRGTESMGPSAVVRFYRTTTKEKILEIELRKANTQLINFNPALVEEYGISTISITEVNTREGWIWFELWK